MASKALFYPFINPPSDEWFNQVLFYWDSVYSIVPDRGSANYSRYAQELKKCELLERVRPENHIYDIPNFKEQFIEILDNVTPPNDAMQLPPMPLLLLKMQPIKSEFDKRGYILGHDLRSSDGESYYVVGWVAELYMSYLASKLSNIIEIHSDPVTNTKSRLNTLVQPSIAILNENRSIILSRVLPLPNEFIEPKQIVAFKKKYRALVSAFRTKIEQSALGLTLIKDDSLFEIAKSNLIHELEDDIRRVEDAMRTKWARITRKTILPIVGAGLGFGFAIVASGAIAASIAAVPCGLTVTNALEDLSSIRRSVREPVAYAVIASRAFRPPYPPFTH